MPPQTLGQRGQVQKVYRDGDLRVQVDSHTWTFNPICCTLLSTGGGHNPENTIAGSNQQDRLRKTSLSGLHFLPIPAWLPS